MLMHCMTHELPTKNVLKMNIETFFAITLVDKWKEGASSNKVK